GDMPVDLQAKLLRVLQSGEVTPVGGRRPTPVDVRILAATHRDLAAAVAAGSFREDLLYRLQVVPIELPPLRERPEDVATLAGHFLDRYGPELTGAEKHLSDECVAFLAGLPWPGNVRELENAIKRAVVLSPSEVLSPEDFAFLTADRDGKREPDLEALVLAELRLAVEREPAADLYRDFLSRVEKPMIEFALSQTDGNQIRAAALLGINRNTLRKKITVLGIDLPGGS
ncbi:MAG: sigma-54-dependent Fis family transcriptional regulator, partial [Myxococcales bacterium]|nr:sigma-54-dependent Fis family transcriptional regulator [Myxococcales bacterium]